ncbi:dead end protein 1 [Megalops cyprinoides]|uniref:dead end protein 1 n=1 Tax=Megalops cyprinoides TaxID=118141 RepID=UPI0018644CE3|nr:dead end protein 1 [Megalops cyprinoides]
MREKTTQFLNPESVASLESWLQRTATKLVQVNGQRKYGGPPPGWTGPEPGPGCEVFISQIPRDVYEDRLIPLFQRVGPLYEFRLMMNFSGQNRGFAYAKYGVPQLADAAIRLLHRHELREGARLAVRRSTEKRQLSLGELPPGVDRERLLQVLRGLSDGVETVTFKFGKGKKKLTAVVHYSSHHCATLAKKVLCEAFQKTFGIVITVKWLSFSTNPRQNEEDKEKRPPSPKSFPQLPTKPCPLPFRHPEEHDHDRHEVHHQPPQDSPRPSIFSPVVSCPPALSQGGGLDAAALLLRVCQLFHAGPPVYDLQYLQTRPDGFLSFAYRVTVPGLPLPFTGVVQILPGTGAATLQDEIRHAAAERILSALSHA